MYYKMITYDELNLPL